MKLTRTQIVDGVIRLVGEEKVRTDEETLKKGSVDRFRKYTSVHGIYDVPLPAAVVYVESTQDVSRVLEFAFQHEINCVSRTGGTATEGGLETVVENSLVIDGSRMDRVLDIDPYSMQVTAQGGVVLQDLDDRLRAMGYTTGHSPQSKPQARLGGLTSTRSTGQFSTLYGGIEEMVVGLEAVFPNGHVARIKNVPRRAAGPDIRHVVIGNEGTLCFITEVTLKLYRWRPENNFFSGWLVDSMKTGIEILRDIITDGYRPSVARVYSEEDAHQHFSHFANGRCVMLFMTEGPAAISRATRDAIEEKTRAHERFDRCEAVDPKLIEKWFSNLNWGEEKIEAEKAWMREKAHLGFTTEISSDWGSILKIYDSAMHRIRTEFPHAGDLTMLGAHSSHSYQNGTNLYFVYDYHVRCEPRDEITQYHIPINAIIVEEALRFGGSMCHHHGIGKYRTDWTEREHGSAYYILQTLKTAFDPRGIMNAGSIFPLQT